MQLYDPTARKKKVRVNIVCPFKVDKPLPQNRRFAGEGRSKIEDFMSDPEKRAAMGMLICRYVRFLKNIWMRIFVFRPDLVTFRTRSNQSFSMPISLLKPLAVFSFCRPAFSQKVNIDRLLNCFSSSRSIV